MNPKKRVCLRGHNKRITGRYKPQGGRKLGKCAECERERNRRRAEEYKKAVPGQGDR